jgi:O-antigen/teichoic acid export membrane protein
LKQIKHIGAKLLGKWLGIDLQSETAAGSVGATLILGAGGSFMVNLASRILAFGIHLFLVRYLGTVSYGIYIYVLSLVNIIYVLINLGYDSSAVRFIPEYTSSGKWGLVRGYISSASLMVLLQSAVAALLGGITLFAFHGRIEPEMYMTLWAGLILIPVRALVQLVAAFLRAFKVVVRALTLSTIVNPLLLAAGILILVHAAGRDVSSSTGMLINAASSAVVLILCWLLLRDILPSAVAETPLQSSIKKWLRVAFPLFLISLFQLILSKTDILMVGSILGTTQAGIYSVASQIALLVSFGLNSANIIIAPMIAQLHSQGRHGDLQRMITMAARGVLAYSFPVLLFVLLWGKWVLGWFGPAFVPGYGILAVLCLGQLVISLTGPVGFLMSMTGYQREAAWVIGVTALLNIILNAVLISLMGVIGAAVATAIVISLRSITLSVFVKKKLKISATALPAS